MADSLFDLAEIEAGQLSIKREPCALRRLVGQICALATEKGVVLTSEIEPGLPESVRVDPYHLRQVLLRLVSCVAGHKGERQASLRAELSERAGDCERPTRELRITVRAAGREARAPDRELSDAARLTRALGGRLDVATDDSSRPGFIVGLPLELNGVAPDATSSAKPAGAATNGSATDRGAAPSMRRGKVLAAEDTPSLQVLLRKMLAAHATRLDVVDDGQAVIDLVQAAAAEGAPYDVILLDMHMPMVSGYDAARRLRESGCDTPIIALTASAVGGDRQRCFEAGCTAYVSKPIDWNTLEAAVQQALCPEETCPEETPRVNRG